MADPFIGQIALFAFGFAPTGWARCEGQLLPISQNINLFSVLGTQYGGDGRSTFALPDLRARAAIGAGQGPELSAYSAGDAGGSSAVTLLQSEMPAHLHGFAASTDQATAMVPDGQLLARASKRPAGLTAVQAPGPTEVDVNFYSPNPANATTALAASSVAPAGQNQPHNNMQPSLAVNFCIALQGTMPVRP